VGSGEGAEQAGLQALHGERGKLPVEQVLFLEIVVVVGEAVEIAERRQDRVLRDPAVREEGEVRVPFQSPPFSSRLTSSGTASSPSEKQTPSAWRRPSREHLRSAAPPEDQPARPPLVHVLGHLRGAQRVAREDPIMTMSASPKMPSSWESSARS